MKPTTTSKRCPGCCKEGETLPVEEFYIYGRSDRVDKVRCSSRCKPCHSIKGKIWYARKCGREPTVCFPNDRGEAKVRRFNSFDYLPPVKEKMMRVGR